MKKKIVWDEAKNQLLKEQRGICFEEILQVIEEGGILNIYKHPNTEKYPNQKMVEVLFNKYVWVIPFVENEDEIFFKTAFPSRKAMKKIKE
ncbi:DUF4258 domain-containing protein [Sulfurospirillum diekertiae]|uniref:Toxin n=1 Tax=Sulfurospirillum diekertiae TaxID=1854492 RepID=A0A1Y0HK92_9BACT|nr:DUF4258 domain-containing protein [Sulfurospirillum diekertiae]ARU48482.1 hypothetical protein Sdiek1_1318 [Sulfurospirillum diekertiae]ASC93316.1 hypothetical protein Sdiek2_1297 [Sulfurospirillum diekertiae]